MMQSAAKTHSQPSDSTRAAGARLQTKLSVSRSNDSHEQEADRVADTVVSSQNTRGGSPNQAAATATKAPMISRLADSAPRTKLQRREEEKEETTKRDKIQRQEEEPQAKIQRQEEEAQTKVQRQEDEPQTKIQRQEEEEAQTKVQRQEDEPQTKIQRQEEEETVQTKSDARANKRDKKQFPELNQVEGKLFANKGKGEKMDDETRVQMETGFGVDFRDVKIHKDGDAVAMNRDLKAQAFAHGKDVFFNAGKYEPDSVRGKTLLAHELTHVVQQGGAEQKVSEQKIEQNNAKRNEPVPDPTDKETVKKEQETEQKIEQIDSQVEGANTPPANGDTGSTKLDQKAPAIDAENADKKDDKKEQGKKEDSKKGEAKKGAKKLRKKAAKSSGKKTKGKGASSGDVGAFLKKATQAAFNAKSQGIKKLADDQKTKESPDKKLQDTQKSVVAPTDESQSRANASQVDKVENKSAPEPDEAGSKQAFDTALENAIPSSLEEVDSFKEEGKGRAVGQAVKGVVSADTIEVKSTYKEIEESPEPAPAVEAEPLPELEQAPETEALNLGAGMVGEVQDEHTDMSNFESESDDMLKEEQIKDEHLEMVDEGDLAEANKERKKVKENVKEGPKQVKKLEQDQKQSVAQELAKEEQSEKQKMQQERQQELLGAQQEQTKTKSKLELKRQAVTDQINSIYETANTTVQQKLENLETQSLKDFDNGEKAATNSFEDNVKRRMDAFKRRRYDRFGGSLLWAKDKLFGMDELPEVKGIFDSEKARFVTAIDGLVKKITAENKKVIQECKDIVAAAKVKIENFVQTLGPELQEVGQSALTDIKGKLQALDKKINDKEQALKKKLEEKREAAIKAIEEKIEKMKEEMSGLISKLGNLLLNAMLKFFEWALKKAGFATDQLMGIINKGKVVIKTIVTDPVGFIGNIIKAVKKGIGQFVTNIKKHLISGLISWLTGAMAEVPITLPDKWDLKGIFSLVLQILGLTWQRIRIKLVKRLGERVVKIAETTVDIVKKLITEGPIALWEMIKEKAAEIKQQVMEGIRNWLIVNVVKQAVIKLLSFLNPAGAIVQAILAIYNTIMFFVENWQRIVEFVKSVFDSIGNIAAGKISAAASKVESALAMTIPIILNFLARLIGLSGIGKAVSNIIKKIRKPIDKIVNKVIDKIVGFAKNLLKKAKKGAGKLKDKVVSWFNTKKKFKNKAGENHTLFFKKKGKKGQMMIASTPQTVESYIQEKKKQLKDNPDPVQQKHLDNADDKQKKAETHTVKHPFKKSDKDAMVADVAATSQAFAKLSGGINPGDIPEPVWSPARGNSGPARPSTVKVDKLSKGKLVAGSTPVDTSINSGVSGWKKIAQKGLTTATNKWVQMHLVNESIGGEGKPYNLVPGPNSVNSGTMRSFESVAKRFVTDNDKNVVWWKSTVSYHGGTFKPYAKSVKMEAGLYLHKGGKNWVKDNKPKIKDVSVVEKPDFSASQTPSLSSASGTQLSAIEYSGGKGPFFPSIFTGTTMTRIKAVRKLSGGFATRSAFNSAIRAYTPPDVGARGLKNWQDTVETKVIPSIKTLHEAQKIKMGG
ncbi:DUF4157 domain-containing protein [Aliiglaciecola sp. M165]|uniref:eCIS core domain-containing protein n=1 Tax=Aliiglaciecola sp. M165 TaxID=2593649 RepID=UPI00117C8F94|nr:DUF4157 domain-containing protein [Aliiglaciecola sp. M165]TRY29844.1 DUF4157 domain-containing protein [Aliiglaciecola sp. M165]